MELAEAFSLISGALDAGRVAPGYLLVGDLEICRALTERVLRRIFPEDANVCAHPDIVWLEPEGAKRIITVGRVRERLVEPMSQTAYSGGWKAGILVSADRLEAPGANALLKTLEEPTPATLYFLLTDSPDAILPTILSRVQRLDLPLSDGSLKGEARDAVAEAFAARDASALAEILGELKDGRGGDDAPDEALAKKAFFRTVLAFVRPFLTNGRLPRYRAFRNIDAVEDAYRQSCRSINDETVIAYMLDRIVLPQ